MKFKIRRTSDWAGLNKPSENSICVKEYINDDDKYQEGEYIIEINTLDELVKLASDGNIVFDGKTIEIYDDYRE